MTGSSVDTSTDKYSDYRPSRHTVAVVEGAFVTFLWSSSFILIKMGLESVPAISFAGLRYALAVVVLFVLLLQQGKLESVWELSRADWRYLALLGVFWYALTPGTMYLGLLFLPAVTVNVILSFAPILVALAGIVTLDERLTKGQWVGIALYLLGVLVYFSPAAFPFAKLLGLAVMVVSVVANAGSTVIGRYVNRDEDIPSLTVTVVSMFVGAVALMVVGILQHGVPHLSGRAWMITVVLALVNTALAYTLWNHALQALTAAEAGIIMSTITFQVVVLEWVTLGHGISLVEGVGIAIVVVGAAVVQMRRA